MVKATLRNAEGTEFGAEEETSATLPEELVEKIIARMPYPSIFKARLLSKSWLARFKLISSLGTAEEKRRAKDFQKQVTQRSINWGTFCRVFTTEEDLVVYDQAQQNWQALPPPSLLPYRTMVPTMARTPHNEPHLEGAFLYHVINYFDEVEPVREGIFLLNILTGEERLLPVHPEEYCSVIVFTKLLIDPFLQTFKVIALCRVLEGEDDDEDQYFAHVYDSKTALWKSKFCFSHGYRVPERYFRSSTFHNGVLYTITKTDWAVLLAFNLEKWTIEELRLTFTHDLNIDLAILVSFDTNLVMIGTKITSKDDGTRIPDDPRVFKVDLVSLQLLEVARCPALELDEVNARTVASQADCVFFNVYFGSYDHSNRYIMEYNKRKDKWRAFSVRTDLLNIHYLDDGYFRPGLNPFMAV